MRSFLIFTLTGDDQSSKIEKKGKHQPRELHSAKFWNSQPQDSEILRGLAMILFVG